MENHKNILEKFQISKKRSPKIHKKVIQRNPSKKLLKIQKQTAKNEHFIPYFRNLFLSQGDYTFFI